MCCAVLFWFSGVVSTVVQDSAHKIFIGGLPSYLNEDQVSVPLVILCSSTGYILVNFGTVNVPVRMVVHVCDVHCCLCGYIMRRNTLYQPSFRKHIFSSFQHPGLAMLPFLFFNLVYCDYLLTFFLFCKSDVTLSLQLLSGRS